MLVASPCFADGLQQKVTAVIYRDLRRLKPLKDRPVG